MLSQQIRMSFLNYFANQQHKILPSSSLLPKNDKTLLLTNAGIVQFKNQLLSQENIKYKRIATAQKCIRTGGKHNDLNNVGYTTKHHTFFEMLGNFSFGDYFKEEAILYAWEFLTKVLLLNKNRLYITVHSQDKKTKKIWQKITNFSDNKIITISSNNNFWSMDTIGPCGPSTEIFYDHGAHYPGGLPGTKNENGNRFVEIWNIVFMQFEKLKSGILNNLNVKSIDTGMGLERLTSIMQGVNNNFDTDIFDDIIKYSKELSKSSCNSISHRIIADHIRSICFLIIDGIVPSNYGSGYVLRKIMRKTIKHVYNLGIKKYFLKKLIPLCIDKMSYHYCELKKSQTFIQKTILIEEEKFIKVIDNGMRYLNKKLSNINIDIIIQPKILFKLYDTYGFPLDLTLDILCEKNIKFNIKNFNNLMKKQKTKGQNFWLQNNFFTKNKISWLLSKKKILKTKFLRNVNFCKNAIIQVIIHQNVKIKEGYKGQKVIVITDKTPFYAESGGQVGDTGWIGNHQNKVIDTKILTREIIGHFLTINTKIKNNQMIKLTIDKNKRKKIMANHSATHLLHYALKSHIGKHIYQRGSLVNDKKLRFDFAFSQCRAPRLPPEQ